MTVTASTTETRIRPLNIRDDLLEVADLIEICFASTLDEEGRDFLRHLRAAARDARYLSWMQSAADRMLSHAPLYGFVWDQDGRIVGNLNLFPIPRGGTVLYWIANVAVHPDYRRLGIARQLTRRALRFLRERGIHTAWLQVRDDNPVAYHLYQSLGFIERYRRSTWQADGRNPLPRPASSGITVRARQSTDWASQADWLRRLYPAEVGHSLSLNIPLLGPGLWSRLLRLLEGKEQEDWCASDGKTLLAAASWQPARGLIDPLWVASSGEREEEALAALLQQARQSLAFRSHPLQVNYPAGRADEAFRRAGFWLHQTLVWMSIDTGKAES